jgi:hypothetical protein
MDPYGPPMDPYGPLWTPMDPFPPHGANIGDRPYGPSGVGPYTYEDLDPVGLPAESQADTILSGCFSRSSLSSLSVSLCLCLCLFHIHAQAVWSAFDAFF